MEIERQTNGAATTHQRSSDVAISDTRHLGAWSSSDLLVSILDGVADGIAAHDASGQLLFINHAGARMCGYAGSGEALAAPAGDFLKRVQVFDEKGTLLAEPELPGPLAAQGRVVPERVVRLQLRLGGERWLSVKATPILDRRGAVRMSISIFRDVTRERCAEAERDRVVSELETERARLSALVEQLRGSSDGTAASNPTSPDR
jgi:PAS domain-containing protein